MDDQGPLSKYPVGPFTCQPQGQKEQSPASEVTPTSHPLLSAAYSTCDLGKSLL